MNERKKRYAIGAAAAACVAVVLGAVLLVPKLMMINGVTECVSSAKCNKIAYRPTCGTGRCVRGTCNYCLMARKECACVAGEWRPCPTDPSQHQVCETLSGPPTESTDWSAACYPN